MTTLSTTTMNGNYIFEDDVTFGGNMFAPDASIDDDHISTNASKRIDDTKIKHRPDIIYSKPDGSNVVSETMLVRVCRGAGQLRGFEARMTTAPNGADTVDIEIETAPDGSAVWTSLLTGAIQFAAADADDTLKTATLIASPVTADGDAIRIKITATAGGSEGQGLVVTGVYMEESS